MQAVNVQLSASMAWWWRDWWSGLLWWSVRLGMPVSWAFVDRVNRAAVRVRVKDVP